MNPNLQIELRRFISSNVLSKLNKFYFENDGLLIKTIDTAIATVLVGIFNKINEEDLYLDTLEYVAESDFYKEIEFDASRLLSVDNCYKTYGDSILSQLFENKKERITEMISNEIGVKSETACEVFNFAALLVFSFLSNQKQELPALNELLQNQKRGILNSIPGGIKIILGYSNHEYIEEQNSRKIATTSIFANLFSSKVS
ncbi:DUF937 domain-containing protein [Flavobacterium agrisoli]|uniref:Uncharacterized protein n=1 Tax=Flavobacterium agrisoli TaxID=2793066 RepID=A0A934UKQ6_9FLAO|nr:DUF937 domain-containing protein [Flavobacterium agrisoli]MBK0370695.1 hypothetical protein [Flavobacterium agrisoli]